MSDFTHPDDAGPDHPGYVTRDGRPARIVCTDAVLDDEQSIVALVSRSQLGRKTEEPLYYNVRGRYWDDAEEHEFDLIDAPKPKKRGVYERWVNISHSEVSAHLTRKAADEYAPSRRLACIHIRQEWEEGEGL